MQSHNFKEIVEMNKKAFKEYLKLVTGCFYSTELQVLPSPGSDWHRLQVHVYAFFHNLILCPHDYQS